MWAWGTFSAVVVQTIAAKTVADHSTAGIADSPQDVQALARLGSSGQNPQHCHAQLVNLLSWGFTFAVTRFICPMLSLKRRAGMRMVVDATHAMVAPFEFFSHLWHDHRQAFADRFLGGEGTTLAEAQARLRGWWGQVSDADPRKQLIRRADEPR